MVAELLVHQYSYIFCCWGQWKSGFVHNYLYLIWVRKQFRFRRTSRTHWEVLLYLSFSPVLCCAVVLFSRQWWRKIIASPAFRVNPVDFPSVEKDPWRLRASHVPWVSHLLFGAPHLISVQLKPYALNGVLCQRFSCYTEGLLQTVRFYSYIVQLNT